MERLLAQKEPERKTIETTVHPGDPPPALSNLHFACRRLLDGLASSSRWSDAATEGIPYKVR